VNKIVRVFLLIVLLIPISLFGLIFFIDTVSWNERSTQLSPDNEWGLYHYHYGSDSNQHAPYGDYVILHKESLRFEKSRDGHVIFAGYCHNALDFKWVTNNHIQIICSSSKEPEIRTISKRAFGKSIDYHYKPNS